MLTELLWSFSVSGCWRLGFLVFISLREFFSHLLSKRWERWVFKREQRCGRGEGALWGGEEKGCSFLPSLSWGHLSWEMQRYHKPGLGSALCALRIRGETGGVWGQAAAAVEFTVIRVLGSDNSGPLLGLSSRA